jgi:hypothetical protein
VGLFFDVGHKPINGEGEPAGSQHTSSPILCCNRLGVILAKLPRDLGLKRKTLMVLITEADVKEAMKVLRQQLKDGSPKDKIEVAQYLLDQRFGRPRQAVEHSGEDGKPIAHTVDVTIHAPG